MTKDRYSHYLPDSNAPFKLTRRGGWFSYALAAGALSAAFTTGVWYNNIIQRFKSLEERTTHIEEAQVKMQHDIDWLVQDRKSIAQLIFRPVPQYGEQQSNLVASNP